LRAADPAGGVLVVLAVAVPVELHLDAAVLVGMDLLARRPGHDRGLRALHDRPPRAPERTEGNIGRNARKLVAIARPVLGLRDLLVGQRLRLLTAVLDRDQKVPAVEVRMVLELDREAGLKAPADAGARTDQAAPALLLQPHFGVALASARILVLARVVVHLER